MKVFKFRSLGDKESFDRVSEILCTGKFRCSRFWEMNDPMEGYYKGTFDLSEETAGIVFGEKAARLICCFSKEVALRNPLMWGYYANGFKGLAIEVEIEEENLYPIVYSNTVSRYARRGCFEERVKSILTRKLDCWKHEREVRYFQTDTQEEKQLYQIGIVTGIVVGLPYPKKYMNENVYGRWEYFHHYEDQACNLIDVALKKKLSVKSAAMRNGRVIIEDIVNVEQ